MDNKDAASSRRPELLPLLKKAAGNDAYLSRAAVSDIAAKEGLPLNEVFAVGSFYSFLPVRPSGKNIIRVCEALPCVLKDSAGVLDDITALLGIKPGETTPDGKFSLEVAGCIGACDEAPAMLVNGKIYGKLTKEKIAGIIKSL